MSTKARYRPELVNDPGSAASYLYLNTHPGPGVAGCVANTLILEDFIPGYQGPDIHLDFSKDGGLIGIEILSSETQTVGQRP